MIIQLTYKIIQIVKQTFNRQHFHYSVYYSSSPYDTQSYLQNHKYPRLPSIFVRSHVEEYPSIEPDLSSNIHFSIKIFRSFPPDLTILKPYQPLQVSKHNTISIQMIIETAHTFIQPLLTSILFRLATTTVEPYTTLNTYDISSYTCFHSRLHIFTST